MNSTPSICHLWASFSVMDFQLGKNIKCGEAYPLNVPTKFGTNGPSGFREWG